MTHKIISVHFTSVGTPITGLTPTIDIYELNLNDPSTNTLIVVAGETTEIGSGWYRYDFLTYDDTKNYVYTFDGGDTLTAGERYKIGGNESYVEEISSEVWNEPSLNHLEANTTGFLLTQIHSDSSSIMISQVTLTSLINTVLKYERNRTKIDVPSATLTIYDNDGVTPLTIFSLKDHLGNLSVSEVCERLPI
jgi:hypothetical protein